MDDDTAAPGSFEPDPIEPDHPEVLAFWELARFHARLNAAPSYFGPTTLEVVVPPAWSYGDDAAEADAFAAAAVAGEATSTTASLAEYEEADAPLPVSGSLSILCDGSGKPVALLETRGVEVADGSVIQHFAVVYTTPE